MESNRAVSCLRLTLSDPDGGSLSVHFIDSNIIIKDAGSASLMACCSRYISLLLHAHHNLFVVTAVTALSL